MSSIIGDSNPNPLIGTQGADTLTGGGGNDTLSGGAGFDVATFGGPSSGYRFGLAGGAFLVTDIDPANGDDGSDQIVGVELLRFSDRDFTLTSSEETPSNSTTTEDQSRPSIAVLQDGSTVISWNSFGQDGEFSGVVARRFDAGGMPTGGEFIVNSTTLGNQDSASVAALGGGGFVVTWNSNDVDQEGVFARLFTADGTPAGTDFQINTYTTLGQFDPAVTGLSSGGFAVTWFSDGQDGSGWGIYARVFDASGNALGSSDIAVNQSSTDEQYEPAIAALAGGGFVIVWDSLHDLRNPDVYGRVFDAQGTATGGEFRVNLTTTDVQSTPDVAVLADGSFVVVWTSTGQDGDRGGIFARHFSNEGSALSGEIAVNITTTASQTRASVAALDDGGYVIAWTSDLQDGSSGGVFSRTFGPDDLPTSDETGLNVFTAGNQTLVDIAGLPGGGIIAAWQSADQDGSGTGVFAAAKGPALSPLQTLVSGSDLDDVIDLRGGGFLRAAGGKGNDVYVVAGPAAITELVEGGIDSVEAHASFTLGAEIENLSLFGIDGFSGAGNALANRINGNGAANYLNGAGGSDTLEGGAGNDTLVGGGALDSDVLVGGDGDDLYVVSPGDLTREISNQGLDQVNSSSSWTLRANIENLLLTGSAPSDGTGNASGNVLTGNQGANVLSGLGGNDSIFGSAGRDLLLGGDGNDTLSGGIDADTLRGGLGDDFYIFGFGDSVNEFPDGGYDVLQSSIAVRLLAGNIEELRLSGGASCSATGNATANLMLGNSGNNRLNGSGGADTLSGGDGADTLFGGLGADHLAGGSGTDLLVGGAGADAFVFDAPLAPDGAFDIIQAFSRAQRDKIVLDDDVFSAFDAGVTTSLAAGQLIATGEEVTASTRLIYDKSSGALYYDPDGSGTTFGAIEFAQIGRDVHPLKLMAADFVITS